MDDWRALWMFLLSMIAAAGGWYFKTMREDLHILRNELRELEACINKLSQRMSGDKVRTDVSMDRLTRIDAKLDLIVQSLSTKVDKDDCRSMWTELHRPVK